MPCTPLVLVGRCVGVEGWGLLFPGSLCSPPPSPPTHPPKGRGGLGPGSSSRVDAGLCSGLGSGLDSSLDLGVCLGLGLGLALALSLGTVLCLLLGSGLVLVLGGPPRPLGLAVAVVAVAAVLAWWSMCL